MTLTVTSTSTSTSTLTSMCSSPGPCPTQSLAARAAGDFPSSAAKFSVSSHYVGSALKEASKPSILAAVSPHLPRISINARVSGRVGNAGQIIMYESDGSVPASGGVASLGGAPARKPEPSPDQAEPRPGGAPPPTPTAPDFRAEGPASAEAATGPPPAPMVPRGVVVFDYGAVVMLGVAPAAERAILEALTKLERDVSGLPVAQESDVRPG